MDSKEKKQLVDRIRKSTNILVTVGTDPSVDALAAAIGLTLVLGKLDKHATAVFSGAIPSAISFLEPDKTFEDTVDGLRDFIIALNKDKADHLRYKLDGDVVKIFITPYKNTIIRDTDFEFSQGDFNVELIIALGVANKADLDSAVSAHGRILHDATTITLSAGSDTSTLGELDWHAEKASSLCEMLVRLTGDLGDSVDGKALLDEHVATALLTGIVANTERFSNNLTTSEVMKTAATLMASGANQQLIATRLDEAEDKEEPTPPTKRDEPQPPKDDDDATIERDGTMQIRHQAPASDDSDDRPRTDRPLHGQSIADIERHKEEVLQDALEKVVPAAHVDLDELKKESGEDQPKAAASHKPVVQPTNPAPRFIVKPSAGILDDIKEPSMGGTLNATTEQAEEDARAIVDDDRNRVILSHNAPPARTSPLEELPTPLLDDSDEASVSDTGYDEPPAPKPVTVKPAAKPSVAPKPVITATPEPVTPQPSVKAALQNLGYPAGSNPTLADLDQRTGHATNNSKDDRNNDYDAPTPQSSPSPSPVTPLGVEDARAAVASALDSSFSPANNPAANVGSQPFGTDAHATLPPLSPLPAAPQQPPVSTTAIDLPPLPPMPPLPGNDGGLPPLPPLPDFSSAQSSVLDIHDDPSFGGSAAAPAPSVTDWQAHTVEAPSDDPGQFRIPGQK